MKNYLLSAEREQKNEAEVEKNDRMKRNAGESGIPAVLFQLNIVLMGYISYMSNKYFRKVIV
jgi:hypothetical protein